MTEHCNFTHDFNYEVPHIMRVRTFWMNAEEGCLECVTHRSREDADRHARLLHQDYPERVRTACLKLVVTWEDGHGLEETPINLKGENDE